MKTLPAVTEDISNTYSKISANKKGLKPTKPNNTMNPGKSYQPLFTSVLASTLPTPLLWCCFRRPWCWPNIQRGPACRQTLLQSQLDGQAYMEWAWAEGSLLSISQGPQSAGKENEFLSTHSPFSSRHTGRMFPKCSVRTRTLKHSDQPLPSPHKEVCPKVAKWGKEPA